MCNPIQRNKSIVPRDSLFTRDISLARLLQSVQLRARLLEIDSFSTPIQRKDVLTFATILSLPSFVCSHDSTRFGLDQLLEFSQSFHKAVLGRSTLRGADLPNNPVTKI